MSMTSSSVVDSKRTTSDEKALNEKSPSGETLPLVEQFYERYRSFKANEAPAIDKEEIKNVFEILDENHDGLISKGDLRQFMGRLGFLSTEEEISSMVTSVDVNGDGNVDFAEFTTLYEMMANDDIRNRPEGEGEEALKEAFNVFDANTDGVISPSELQEVLVKLGMSEGQCLTTCQEMISNVDSNGDGAVDFTEFKKLMSGDIRKG